MKEGVLLFAIIAAVDVRDHKAHDYDARDHEGRTGTYGDYCSYTNNDCASGYHCDMWPNNPYCVPCPG